jgi:transposase
MDESGIEHRLFREFCRAPRGTRVYETISGACRKRTSVIGAWREGQLLAPLVLDGACDSQVMDAYFSEILFPVLPPKSVVVWDNASFHHDSHVEQLAREHGIEMLYLPAYSPDLNPIEHFWAHLKGHLRKKLPAASSAWDEICRACRFFCEKRLNVE